MAGLVFNGVSLSPFSTVYLHLCEGYSCRDVSKAGGVD
jgi:hypothetical protein